MKPILFKTEMVKAILDGRKTVTRRVIKGLPLSEPHSVVDEEGLWIADECGEFHRAEKYSKIQPGMVLYVQETFATTTRKLLSVLDGGARHWSAEGEGPLRYIYKADCTLKDYPLPPPKWRPSIHMPKEAARIFLRVTDVRATVLQNIQPEDIWKEAIPYNGQSTIRELYDEFALLWDSTIKPVDLERYGWDANPWVWVITFERINKKVKA